MNYVITSNNSVTFGPSPWNSFQFQSILNSDFGITNSLPATDPGTPVILTDTVSVVPVASITYPSFNNITQQLAGPNWTVAGNSAVATYTVVDKPIQAVRSNLKDMAAINRYRAEVAGTTAVVNGANVTVTTDRVGKQVYFQQLATATDTPINFKIGTTWVQANVQDFGNITTAITNYVQSTFNWEANLAQYIDSLSTLTALANVVTTFGANVSTQ